MRRRQERAEGGGEGRAACWAGPREAWRVGSSGAGVQGASIQGAPGKMQRTPSQPAGAIRGLGDDDDEMPAATIYEALTTSHREELFTNAVRFHPQNDPMQFTTAPLTATALCCFQICTRVSSDKTEVRHVDVT